MASSVNKVIIIGNLGKDPETRFMPNGDAVTNLSVATSESWKDKNGEKQEKTEWHRVTLFKNQASIAPEFTKKGSKVYIEGRLQTKEWEDKQGIKRYTTETIASEFKMLDGVKEKEGQAPQQQQQNQRSNEKGGSVEEMESDIPF